MEPTVSILWLNHNSSSFVNLAMESLNAVRKLEYSNCELIVVDNGSTDDSQITIKNFVEKINVSHKYMRLDKNLGFTGGNNVAYASRNAECKYVVLLNSDAVPQSGSLRKLVDAMEKDATLGAVQGVILDYNGRKIDTAGDFLSEILVTYPLFEGKRPDSLRKPVYITSADGAYSIYRVDAINKTMKQTNKMFDDFIFACYDDYSLGLRLWNSGFKVKTLPIITAKHKRGSSFRKVKPLLTYLYIRNWIILNEISNSRYRNLLRLLYFKQLSASFISAIAKIKADPASLEYSRILTRAVVDGMRIGSARKRLGERINLYKAPVLPIDASAALSGFAISLRLANMHAEKELQKIAC